MDIKRLLGQLSDRVTDIGFGRWTGPVICREAVAEIERQAEVIRTLGVELDIARAAVRRDMPEVTQLTRHTITLQRPLPAMDVGDSLLLVVVPPPPEG
jgi:hypothetical protein